MTLPDESAPIIRDFLDGPLPDTVTRCVARESPSFAALLIEYPVNDFSENWAHPIEMHRGFEVGVVIRGQDERSSTDGTERLGAGQVWLHSMWEPHGGAPREGGTTEVVFIFLPEFLGEERLGDVSWLALFAVPPAQRARATSPQTREAVLAIARDMMRELREQPPACETALRLCLLRLLLLLSRAWVRPVTLSADRLHRTMNDLPRIIPALELVQAHSTRRVTVREAAAACGFSVTHFKRMFRNAMGVAFGRFCLRTRLALVAKRLVTTDLPEETIAHEMGFVDASHLHHDFARHFGTTPGRYRRRIIQSQ